MLVRYFVKQCPVTIWGLLCRCVVLFFEGLVVLVFACGCVWSRRTIDSISEYSSVDVCSFPYWICMFCVGGVDVSGDVLTVAFALMSLLFVLPAFD